MITRFVHSIAVLGGSFFLVASATIALTRFNGGVALLWLATALLIAWLATAPRRTWPAAICACAGASFCATSLFGMGVVAAGPLALINVAEAVLATVLLRRFQPDKRYFETLRGILIFFLIAALAAPALSAPLGALTASWVTGTDFLTNLGDWWIGHGLGTLTFCPIFLLLLRGEVGRWWRSTDRAVKAEALALIAIVAATTVATFVQQRWPLLFLPVLPAMIATWRLGRLGAAVSVVAIAIVGGCLTVGGLGPIFLTPRPIGEAAHFFQFYTAVLLLTVLPIAADMKQRKTLFEKLQESEARFRLVTENSTDIVMHLGLDGTFRYVSPAIQVIAGHDPQQLIGRKAQEIIDPVNLQAVIEAHLKALRNPRGTYIVEYRGVLADGSKRWFETHTRATLGPGGEPDGLVCTVRDIAHRKDIETRLHHAATTDPLTGLANRRAFTEALDTMLARSGGTGCLALFDIDHFKSINDRFGHDAGDDLLVAFARLAEKATRRGDMVARLGGEEFALVLADVALDEARQLCERLRIAIEDAVFTARDGRAIRMTVSAGIVVIAKAESRVNLMRSADAALYEAKALGRNRLRIAA